MSHLHFSKKTWLGPGVGLSLSFRVLEAFSNLSVEPSFLLELLIRPSDVLFSILKDQGSVWRSAVCKKICLLLLNQST